MPSIKAYAQRLHMSEEKATALYQIAYTGIDFLAAFSFIIGSILFFWEAHQFSATMLFLVGSILFALKPTLRTIREVFFLAEGDYDYFLRRDGEDRD
ncbi:YrhK family protein [Pseudohoeflea coraliihabitans]|uniref:YrhK family protein n=1 Tax=Pseudohoeflea coraliihabitans TaxID=2860393 RepID=A0ABS6WSM1_9HYPH|nr:YrhK family protein [Pseudohoeflea sp. DP4N28-3]MBW3098795.1 YrhK family protein [Pseudohoeflea sp. DP4N28-3]